MSVRESVELSIIVPVYQEEVAIPLFLQRAVPVLESIAKDYEIIFSVDPGRDRTLDVIQEASAKNPRIRALVMTRRWGQDACMIAGLKESAGKACVIIDVDLQDPPALIRDLVAKWREGWDVVYAQRRTRAGDPWMRRLVAFIGYRVINRISEVAIPRDTGDFRLLDRKVVLALGTLKETHGFLRGLVPYVGYRQTSVLYDRTERQTGQSKYGAMFGSIRHGVNGIVAFSSAPISLVTVLGLVLAASSIVWLAVALGMHFAGVPLSGWSALIIFLVLGVGGTQLVCMGILGEYIGRIYEESRMRPHYMIATKINFPGESRAS